MFLINFILKRPIFIISIIVVIIIVGILAIFKLPWCIYPKVESSVISISMNYPGASAETMESFVATTLESALSGIEHVNYISSQSNPGNTLIKLYLELGANSNDVFTEVTQRMSAERNQLPAEVENPVIKKSDLNDNSLLILAFTSPIMSQPEISDYLVREVKPKWESIEGVSNVEILGSKLAIGIELEPNKMLAYHIDMKTIASALKQQNLQSTIGNLDTAGTNFDLTLNSNLAHISQFNAMVIQNNQQMLIRLSDVARAVLTRSDDHIRAYYNGRPAVMVFVKTKLKANPFSTHILLKKAIAQFQSYKPSFLQLHIFVDMTHFMVGAIKEVIISMMATLLVVNGIIWLFLGTLRVILIPIMSIMISLLGVCFILWVTNNSFNLLTLLAMSLAIGLIADDAIVIIENIYRHMAHEALNRQLVKIGTEEVFFSIIAMCLTLVAIFIPILFLPNIIGELFNGFFITLLVAVILSALFSLFISPLLFDRVNLKCSYTQKSFMLNLLKKYRALLYKCFQFKYSALLIWIFSIPLCFYFYEVIPKELVPKEKQQLLRVLSTLPPSISGRSLLENSHRLNSFFQSFPNISSYVVVSGIPNTYQKLSFLHSEKSSFEIQKILQDKLDEIPSMQSTVMNPSLLPIEMSLPIEFVIKSTGSYKRLYSLSQKILYEARKSGIYEFLLSDLDYNKPLLFIKVNRLAASAMGINLYELNKTLSLILNEYAFQYFSWFGQRYPVIFKLNKKYKALKNLKQLEIPSKKSFSVPLYAFSSFHIKIVPEALNRFQQSNSVTISGMMSPGHSLSEGLHYLKNLAKKNLRFNEGFDYAGLSREYRKESKSYLFLFLISIGVIFIVLATLFKNFFDPWIILGSLPMTVASALLPSKIGLSTFNIYSEIGILILIGLISKHGILLVNFANKVYLQKNISREQAIVIAAESRFRPILMTTLIIVCGTVPLIFSSGTGSSARFDLGITLLVGMSLGTLFTLFILPILYCLRFKKFSYKKEG